MAIEQIYMRDVGAEQIYDSYAGILRISPSDLDGEIVDSMSLPLASPRLKDKSLRKTILSDSDGIQLGLYFTSYVRLTDVYDAEGNPDTQNVINVASNSDANLFASNSYNARSTIVVNKEKQQDRLSPIQVYTPSQYYVGVWNVLAYPIESPRDDSYFNTDNKLGLIDYSSPVSIHEQLNDSLYHRSKAWYDENIGAEHRVKIANKFIYTQNVDYEEIPVLYTKDYVLGQYTGHTAYVTEDVKIKFVGTTIGPDRLVTGQSQLTKLSFICLDNLVWDTMAEALQGYLRHSSGRYTQLGINQNGSISERLFDKINPPTDTAPILGQGVASGLIFYHAMPFKRFMFHTLRQVLHNAEDEANNMANLTPELKAAYDKGTITAIKKFDPGFVNGLTKEFVLCNGFELTYDNYPSVNTDNLNMFQHDDRGVVKRGVDGKPLANDKQTDIVTAIANSNSDKKMIVPSLLVTEQQSPRYLRGLNWFTMVGTDTAVDYPSLELEAGTYDDNDKKHEVVQDSEYGMTDKNFSTPGAYRYNVDWKVNAGQHRHVCFAVCNDWNRTSKGNSFGSILYNSRTSRPWSWKTLDETPPDRDDLIRYSFTKMKEDVVNAWAEHTPVPSAGMFAWKVVNGECSDMLESDVAAGTFVIQNEEQVPIAADKTERLKQLELMNYAEGAAPIAIRGGNSNTQTYNVHVWCKKHKKFHIHCHEYNDWWNVSYTGGYSLQTEVGHKDDKYRCVTSLPVKDIESLSTKHEDPLKVQMGDKEIEPDTSLSFPPTLVLLPIFKI